MTTTEGWHYSGQIAYPADNYTFKKDISQAAPGTAGLDVTVSGAPLQLVDQLVFSPDNPGRQNGQLLILRQPVSLFQVPSEPGVNTDITGNVYALDTPPCGRMYDWWSNQISLQALFSFPFYCSTVTFSEPNGRWISSGSVDESSVDAIIAQLNLEEPVTVFQINDCFVIDRGDGNIAKYAESPGDTSCDTVTAKV